MELYRGIDWSTNRPSFRPSFDGAGRGGERYNQAFISRCPVSTKPKTEYTAALPVLFLCIVTPE